MELQDLLIFILFVFAWGISLLSKKLQGKLKKGEKKGFILKILEFIAELKEASERGMNAEPRVSILPEPGVNVRDIETTIGPNLSDSDLSFVDNLSPETYVSKDSLPCDNVVIHKRAMAPSSVMVPSEKRFSRKTCRKKLREAVVWSEILGPPVALKKNSKRRKYEVA